MKISVYRGGDYVEVDPQNLSQEELCGLLSGIDVGDADSYGNFRPKSDAEEAYAVIREAIRRLEASSASTTPASTLQVAQNWCQTASDGSKLQKDANRDAPVAVKPAKS